MIFGEVQRGISYKWQNWFKKWKSVKIHNACAWGHVQKDWIFIVLCYDKPGSVPEVLKKVNLQSLCHTVAVKAQRELSKRSWSELEFKTRSANVTNPINMLICFSVRWTRFELEFVGGICPARARFSIFNSQEVIFLLLEYGLDALESNVNRNSL